LKNLSFGVYDAIAHFNYGRYQYYSWMHHC